MTRLGLVTIKDAMLVLQISLYNLSKIKFNILCSKRLYILIRISCKNYYDQILDLDGRDVKSIVDVCWK